MAKLVNDLMRALDDSVSARCRATGCAASCFQNDGGPCGLFQLWMDAGEALGDMYQLEAYQIEA